MKQTHTFILLIFTLFLSCQKNTETKKTESVMDSVSVQSNTSIISDSLISEDYDTDQPIQLEINNSSTPVNDLIRNEEYFQKTRSLRYRFDDLEGSVYLRAALNENHPWIDMLRELDQSNSKELQAFIGVTFEDLIELALLYGKNNGRRTNETEVLRKKISNALSPSTEELERYQSLIEGPKFEVNTLSEDIAHELKRLIEYHRVIDNLENYLELRKKLSPLRWDLCPSYYDLRKKINEQNTGRNDSILNSLYASHANISVNQSFLNALLALKKEDNNKRLTIEKPIAPIFNNYHMDTIGIYGTDYNNSGDARLIEQTTYKEDLINMAVPNGELLLYDSIDDQAYYDNSKTNIFSTTKAITANIAAFGISNSECDNGYSFFLTNIKKSQLTNQSIMFASPFDLDLDYKNYPSIDSLINAQYPGICVDCPSSFDQQVTFASLSGFDNLYFTYANELGKALDNVDTPLRGLYYVKNDIVIRVWMDYIDAFGCACL
ncbi:hypothetical protein ACV07N_05025 [Roseivirga echinicomitans]